jgi:hypothetical protein
MASLLIAWIGKNTRTFAGNQIIMSIHQLYIFAKNRDAIAAQKGYSFQQLKTLEDWIENRISGDDKVIYCDYEDDILSRNFEKGTTTFTQIKLYKDNFSFSSESIKKAIAHFFMLYTKIDFASDQRAFHFETNVSIVKKEMKGNDSTLLAEWFKQQDNLPPDLIERIRVRVKKIIDEYIDETFAELSAHKDLISQLQKAKDIYDNLKDGEFDAFIHCIKWKFDGLDSGQAIDQLVARIESLVPQIPLHLDDKKTSIYSALLITEVFHRSMKDDPEERKLSKDLLDAILLNAGESIDQWYVQTVEQFKGFTLQRFYPGELQAVINAARYCRWSEMDSGHQAKWLTFLQQYIQLEGTPLANKRKAIYEYLFLKVGHNPLEERTESAITEDLELVNFYFVHWQEWINLLDIEDDLVLLQLLKGQVMRFGLAVKTEDITTWEGAIQTYLQTEVTTEKNVDRLCTLLELQGFLTQQAAINQPVECYKASFEFYRKIPPLLDKAQFYSLARLYDLLQQKLKKFAEWSINDELNNIVDQFMLEIQPYAEKTGLHHKAAEEYKDRAIRHIEHHDLPNYLTALDLLHRAKGLWRKEYSRQGYVLSLIGLSQVYGGLGMTYAAKYYALVSFWSTWHLADPKLYKYLHTAVGEVQHMDFRHGAWMNAIEDFNHYLFAKRQFDEKGFDIYDDKTFGRSLAEIAMIIHATPLIHPEMSEFIDSLKPKWGFVYTDHIRPRVEELAQKFCDKTALKPYLENILNNQPLSDVGPTRNISFNALGNDWHIKFANNEAMTATGEEFVSFLQIILCELVRTADDNFTSGRQISITIEQGHFQKQQTGTDNWIITIPGFDSMEQPQIQHHYTYTGALVMGILQSISTLSKQDFIQFYVQKLLKIKKVGERALEATAYQRIFKHIIGTSFEVTGGRAAFNAADDNIVAVTFLKYLKADG